MQETGVWTNTEDENYAAALMVLPERWAPLAKQLGGKLILAAPARNRVFVSAPLIGNGLEAFTHIVKLAVSQEDHPLVATLFTWTPQGFKPMN